MVKRLSFVTFAASRTLLTYVTVTMCACHCVNAWRECACVACACVLLPAEYIVQGVVTLLTEEEGGAWHHGLPESIHDGYVTFSEVEGMYAKDEKALLELGLNINTSGPWKVAHNTRKVSRKQRDGTYKVRAPALACHIVSMRVYAHVVSSYYVYAAGTGDV